MQITYSKFEHDLNRFLKAYLEDDSFDNLKERLDISETEVDLMTEKINDFYKEQLQINNNQSKERIKIDRIITFSEKRLSKEKFCKFLIELARICLSEGKLDLAIEIFRKANKINHSDSTNAESLLGLADVFSRRAIWLKCVQTANNAKTLFKSINDYKGVAKCENLLGTVYGELGDIIKAKKHLLTSLSLINIDEDLDLAANLFANLGIIYNIQENFDDSIQHLKRSLSIYQTLGNLKCSSEINLNIGMVYYDSKNYDPALAAIDSSIEIARKEDFISILCLAYLAKAQLLIQLENFYYAAEFADKALELSHNLDDKLTVADIYKAKGIIEKNLSNYKSAETYLLSSLRINKSLNNEMNAAETSLELGLLYEKMHDSSSKDSYLKSSCEYFKNIGANTKADWIEGMIAFNSAI
ncbi:MAG: tetratricopeptide repeat protein [Ignavibacteriales bacterium]